MNEAATLKCPMCGAAAEKNATCCLYCEAPLAMVACPHCFGMMFAGSRHCSHCGARADRAVHSTEAGARCPRCRFEMGKAIIGAETLGECAKCGGLWVETEAFERICAGREEQSAVLGAATFMAQHNPGAEDSGNAPSSKVRYVPCPRCGQLMNRVNFARCSGVIVDVCKKHGTWFDRDELRRIVEFIQEGGLVSARAREKQQILDMQRKLRQEQLGTPSAADHFTGITDADQERHSILAAARELLKVLRD